MKTRKVIICVHNSATFFLIQNESFLVNKFDSSIIFCELNCEKAMDIIAVIFPLHCCRPLDYLEGRLLRIKLVSCLHLLYWKGKIMTNRIMYSKVSNGFNHNQFRIGKLKELYINRYVQLTVTYHKYWPIKRLIIYKCLATY